MNLLTVMFSGVRHSRSKKSLQHLKGNESPTCISTDSSHIPHESISDTLTPTTIKFWHELSTASLRTLLQKSNYPESQLRHFLALWRHTLPYLTQGPNESPTSFKSKLSRDGTPYDMQWNLVASPTSISDSIVRVSFDIGTQPKEFIVSLSKLGFLAPSDANIQLLDSALETLAAVPQESAHAPWFASGIDMLRSSQLLYKVYLRPATGSARALSHKRANAVVTTWDEKYFNGGLAEAYSVIENYNTDLEEDQMQKVHMLGWDCVEVEKSRVKVYTYHSHTSLRALKEMWTQRGQLTGPEIDIGLQCIDELWDLLFAPGDDEPLTPGFNNTSTEGYVAAGDERETIERLSRLGTPQSICLGLEIKSGAKLPTPKLYLQPARFGTKSDKDIAITLQKWFEKRGFGEICGSYDQDFAEIFPHRDHTLEAGCHSFMSLAVKKGGRVAITLYLQPMVYKTLEESFASPVSTPGSVEIVGAIEVKDDVYGAVYGTGSEKAGRKPSYKYGF